MQPLDYCRQKAAESRSSFLAAFRFLPQRRQDAMTVLYAFCRELDDVVDDCTDMQVAQTTLNWWRADLAKVFDGGAPEHPVCRALQGVVAEFALPHDELAEIIEGMQMDLTQARYANFAELQLYCHRVAGVVGRLITRILGFSRPETLDYADKMGLALQLTNIIRDVGEDARNGRIYLPMEDLQRFDVPAQTIMQAAPTPQFAELMAFQIARARATYREALALLPAADKKAQKMGLILAAIYYALLNEIERDGAQNVLKYKIAIPGPRKKRIALKIWLFGFKP
ncbi:MAG: presqualene diphosphate synthase HpnD [Neisseria sp.]|uniref:presqualene diphosphate synthase HpnD n=1 Tax=Uruburuella suis TaxID=252130 RepID=UPI001B442F44|nr:presqualene diphosphate synthase HpnD [Neisseria sp.]MBP7258323.1 presqualene diphosphate synthase HpnD [Neisseria sp.]MBP8043241.1 presqualene diphosphate synthase HpnD [Neisseria sp.]MBP8876321.1 presqualene diphosphate synthase HpnD [Neisseria sp.]